MFGFIVMVDPVHYDSKFNYIFDFSEIRWPFGIVLFVLGLYTLYRAVKSKAEDSDNFSKCPKCMKTYDKSKLNNGLCPVCGIETEPLKGFFERHPG